MAAPRRLPMGMARACEPEAAASPQPARCPWKILVFRVIKRDPHDRFAAAAPRRPRSLLTQRRWPPSRMRPQRRWRQGLPDQKQCMAFGSICSCALLLGALFSLLLWHAYRRRVRWSCSCAPASWATHAFAITCFFGMSLRSSVPAPAAAAAAPATAAAAPLRRMPAASACCACASAAAQAAPATRPQSCVR